MLKNFLLVSTCFLILLTTECLAQEADAEMEKEMSGMSVLGNSEAPKSLVIVPWKTSEIGDGVGVANMLDGRAAPVDRDGFSREIEFYELRNGAGARGVPIPPAAPAASGAVAQQ
jgi:hypothetical protein